MVAFGRVTFSEGGFEIASPLADHIHSIRVWTIDRKGSLTGHFAESEVRPPSPPQIRLGGSLIKVVRFIFSHRGLIRYK
jgi:hypothetical protein